MKFSDLTRCPFCGNDEFYTKQQIKGSCYYIERFDGEYLGNRTKDTVSIEVEKLYKRNGV